MITFQEKQYCPFHDICEKGEKCVHAISPEIKAAMLADGIKMNGQKAPDCYRPDL